MAEKRLSPYVCHVFVCTNDRHGTRRSCADGNSPAVREALKRAVNDRGWRGRVRVSESGCLGLCDDGPNILLYPQRTWFSGVTPEDVPEILAESGPTTWRPCSRTTRAGVSSARRVRIQCSVPSIRSRGRSGFVSARCPWSACLRWPLRASIRKKNTWPTHGLGGGTT